MSEFKVKIVREDALGNVVEVENRVMPTEGETIEVFNEFKAYGNSSAFISQYPHVGGRPNDRK